jgi:hypothetical protein
VEDQHWPVLRPGHTKIEAPTIAQLDAIHEDLPGSAVLR